MLHPAFGSLLFRQVYPVIIYFYKFTYSRYHTVCRHTKSVGKGKKCGKRCGAEKNFCAYHKKETVFRLSLLVREAGLEAGSRGWTCRPEPWRCGVFRVQKPTLRRRVMRVSQRKSCRIHSSRKTTSRPSALLASRTISMYFEASSGALTSKYWWSSR